ncbi:hypothetical protein GALMADRAFT_252685 [Galerina marginata CBS 339.88]|uniref:N-acetyltransferase domain-containing protein n=1 Tax=Galerina marginata (strain CBS 339.88) TaxID=685588 RepID=A0A067SXZ8_GALM3|nr:hypothetical protein GALMADRAFT_252685 [Galerina marginata CBS 339.88]
MFDLPEIGIRLRGFQGDKDLDQIMLMENDREIATLMTIHFLVPQGEQTRELYKKNIAEHTEMFCIIETIPPTLAEAQSEVTAVPEFVGFVGLFAGPDRGQRLSMLSIAFVKKFWNKGYGTAVVKFVVDYAFRNLNMHRISLGTTEGNDRAIAVYKKCGFVLEGRDRKNHWVDGGWKDLIRMGIIIDDWIEMNKKEKA